MPDMKKLLSSPSNESLSSERSIRRKTVGSFLIFFLLAVLAVWGWKQLRISTPDRLSNGVRKPLRTVLDANEKIFNKNFSTRHLSKTYPKSAAAKRVRVNGDVGMGSGFDPQTWKLQVVKTGGDTMLLTLDDIKKLPKTEIVFDFKCIEGWSQITHWGGVRFSDFVKAYRLDKEASLKYIGMNTPDKEYYVGIDMPSALHPQTLLCYEMNGKPLPMNQGMPLRMIIPVKYGIKSLKRIGTLFFSDTRPPDYWFERGYDYYSGL